MKRLLLRAFTVLLIISAGAAGVSCSKEKESKEVQKVAPPEHAQMVEQMQKGVEESRKVVVAKVNGETITMHALIRQMNLIAPRFIPPGQQPTPEMDEKIEKESLDLLIFEELALQEATRRGLQFPPEKIDEIILNIRTSLGGSDEEYKAYLIRTGLTEDLLRRQIERSNLFQIISAEEIYKKVIIDDKKVNERYEKDKDTFIKPETLFVEDVYFSGGKTDDAAMKKAKGTLDAIKKSGHDLSKLPQDSAYMVRKGLVDRQEYPNIYSALANMKVGDVSGVIMEQDGLHIVKVLQKEHARQMTPEEAKKMIHQNLVNEEAEKRNRAWAKKLRENAKIELFLDELKKQALAQKQGG